MGDHRHLLGEALDVLGLLLEVAQRDEEREVGVLRAGLLDPVVQRRAASAPRSRSPRAGSPSPRGRGRAPRPPRRGPRSGTTEGSPQRAWGRCRFSPCLPYARLMARSRGQSLRKGRRKGFRRQFGLDRSGPPPRQTRPGQPLRPWTIPNAVGYLRLAGAAGLPLPRVLLGRRPRPLGGGDLLADRRGRLRGRLPGPGDGPVQPDGSDPGPDRRPADDPLGGRGLLALRAAAALGARRAWWLER